MSWRLRCAPPSTSLPCLDAVELGHESVEKVFVIFCLVGFGIVEYSEFKKLGIREIIEGEKVGAGFLESGAVSSLSVSGVDTGEELSGKRDRDIREDRCGAYP